MISARLTFAIYLLAAFAGALLYRTSYAVDEVNAKIAATERQIVAAQSNIQVLGAEWTYLTEPSRIEQLASKYLHLETTKTQRVAALHDVNRVMEAQVAAPVPTAMPTQAPAVITAAAVIAKPPLIAPKLDNVADRTPALAPKVLPKVATAARKASPLLSTVSQRLPTAPQVQQQQPMQANDTPNSVKLLLASFQNR